MGLACGFCMTCVQGSEHTYRAGGPVLLGPLTPSVPPSLPHSQLWFPGHQDSDLCLGLITDGHILWNLRALRNSQSIHL